MSELWFAGQFARAGIAFEIHEEAPELAHDPAKGRYYIPTNWRGQIVPLVQRAFCIN